MNATTELDPQATTSEDASSEALVAQRTNTVLFLSRRRGLRLVHTPRYPILAPGSGRQAGEQAGVAFAFSNGQLTCPIEGTITLEDGRAWPANEALEWLEGHYLNGDVNGGFWRVDPEAPAVTMQEIETLVRAAENADLETLRRILAEEQQGWQREQILRVAQGSIERTEQLAELAEAHERNEAQRAQREQELAEREAALEARAAELEERAVKQQADAAEQALKDAPARAEPTEGGSGPEEAPQGD